MGSRGNRTDGGPCLADAAGPGQGDEPDIATAQERLDKPDLAFSPTNDVRGAGMALVSMWRSIGTGKSPGSRSHNDPGDTLRAIAWRLT